MRCLVNRAVMYKCDISLIGIFELKVYSLMPHPEIKFWSPIIVSIDTIFSYSFLYCKRIYKIAICLAIRAFIQWHSARCDLLFKPI